MRNYIVFAGLLLLLGQCDSGRDCCGPLGCVDKLIKSIESKPADSRPHGIYRFEHNEELYYYLPPYCCDFFGDIYDVNCTLVCHPDGGITGQGDGKCGDIVVQNTEPLWEDK